LTWPSDTDQAFVGLSLQWEFAEVSLRASHVNLNSVSNGSWVHEFVTVPESKSFDPVHDTQGVIRSRLGLCSPGIGSELHHQPEVLRDLREPSLQLVADLVGLAYGPVSGDHEIKFYVELATYLCHSKILFS
jgi:hypothetical protein